MRCRKSARHCGAKHISKSKVLKTDRFGAILEVEMLKKMQPNSSGAPLTWFTCSPNACLNLSTCMGCTPLWRARISKSKCAKHFSLGAFLKVEMSKKCTPSWREAHVEVKTYKTHRARMCSVLGALLEVEISKSCMPLWREAHLEVKSAKS